MSFDRTALARAIDAHKTVVRVVVADIRGSTPREVGASMLIWENGQSGTIGGGALEFDAATRARQMIENNADLNTLHIPLGPATGQCCGGSVTLVSERFTQASRLPTAGAPFARPVVAQATTRAPAPPNTPAYMDGWLIEPAASKSPVWIFGAGHVGHALATTLAPMGDVDVTLVDISQARMPDLPAHITPLIAADPTQVVQYMPPQTQAFVMTHSHALDLRLCAALLDRPDVKTGLIGSDTKWARFQKRLAALGKSASDIDRITCPIGDPTLGKHPQAIAIGVAASYIHSTTQSHNSKAAAC